MLPTTAKKFDGAVKKKPLSWDDLLTLSTLARVGAYAAAAEALGLTRGTAVRRIERLELALGYQVVTEQHGKVGLTARGQQVLATARQMHDLVLGLDTPASAAASDILGLVRLTAPEGLASYVIAPAIAQLQRAHPGLEIELLADSAILSISHKQADVAVRLKYPEDGNLIALAARPLSYSIMHGATPEPAEGLVTYDLSGADFPETLALLRAYPERPVALRSGSLPVQVEAVRRGAGLSMLPDYLSGIYPELRSLSGGAVLEKPVYIVFHSQHRDQRKIRVVTDWLQGLLGTA